MRLRVLVGAAVAGAFGCGSEVILTAPADGGSSSVAVTVVGSGGSTPEVAVSSSSSSGAGGSGGTPFVPERLCEVVVTGSPFIVDHGDGYSDPATLALTWSRTDGTRLTGFSYQENDIVPPPGLPNAITHVSFEPWAMWPPLVTPPLGLSIGAYGLRGLPSPNDTFAVAGSSGAPNFSYGLRYAANVDPTEDVNPGTEMIGAGLGLLALAGTLERHLLVSTSMTAGRLDLLDNTSDPPTVVASHGIGCGGAPLRGDALREGDGWSVAVTTSPEGCSGEPTGLLLGRVSHDGLLVVGGTMTRPGGFGRMRLVQHAGSPWLIFTGASPEVQHELKAAPVLPDHQLGAVVELGSDFDPEAELAVTPFATGVAIAFHSVDDGVVTHVYADLASGLPSSIVDIADPGPYENSMSLVVGPSGYDVVLGWAASVVDPPQVEPSRRPFVARLGCALE